MKIDQEECSAKAEHAVACPRGGPGISNVISLRAALLRKSRGHPAPPSCDSPEPPSAA